MTCSRSLSTSTTKRRGATCPRRFAVVSPSTWTPVGNPGFLRISPLHLLSRVCFPALLARPSRAVDGVADRRSLSPRPFTPQIRAFAAKSLTPAAYSALGRSFLRWPGKGCIGCGLYVRLRKQRRWAIIGAGRHSWGMTDENDELLHSQRHGPPPLSQSGMDRICSQQSNLRRGAGQWAYSSLGIYSRTWQVSPGCHRT
jgi:hypothetical protein